LLARQLPQIAERLKSTLDKLQRPQIEVSSGISAAEWWARLQDRHAGNGSVWRGDLRGTAELPGALFDSVAENLLQNALVKRKNESGIEISVNLTVDHAPKEALLGCEKIDLAVRDTGQAIAPMIADALFREPVKSELGLGIGLYHAAKQAEEAGYRLSLADNRPGTVVFRLTRVN
jgi:K+-sensing histidine kinase KdpD